MKKKWIIKYVFDGFGTVEVEGETMQEVEDSFYDGDFDGEDEHGHNYEVTEVEEV